MGKLSPRIPSEHNKYHGYTVRGTPHCPLIQLLMTSTRILGGSSQDLDTWLVTMVIVSPLNGGISLINGRFMAYKWGWP